MRGWKTFGERCRKALPGLLVWDESGPFFDPGYRYSVAQPGYVHPSDDRRDPVVCMMSALAPVYAIRTYIFAPDGSTQARHADFPSRYHDRIGPLCALAEDLFGFARLREETLLTVVPDVLPFAANKLMGEATLMDCLFTSHL